MAWNSKIHQSLSCGTVPQTNPDKLIWLELRFFAGKCSAGTNRKFLTGSTPEGPPNLFHSFEIISRNTHSEIALPKVDRQNFNCSAYLG